MYEVLRSLWINCAAGVYVWTAFCVGMVKFPCLMPHFTGHQSVVGVTHCTVIATCVDNVAVCSLRLSMTRSSWCQSPDRCNDL